MTERHHLPGQHPEKDSFSDTWVVVPTFNEAENLLSISAAVLQALPGATVLVVDDSSPDGTGELADRLADTEPRLRVLHRPRKQGLGKAYIDGFGVALDGGAERVVQMDADWSHDPRYLVGLLRALDGGPGTPRPDGADLVIGSRNIPGGGVRNWGIGRRMVSRGGSLFARTVLRLRPHDLTGGFKVWRRDTLAAIPWERVHSGGYVFSIEMNYLASRAGARVVEVPIIFVDRRVGVSKMSRRIILEALVVVVQLRWDELVGRGPGARADAPSGARSRASGPSIPAGGPEPD